MRVRAGPNMQAWGHKYEVTHSRIERRSKLPPCREERDKGGAANAGASVFYEVLQHFDHAGPASGGIVAGYGHGGEAAVRDFYVRSGGLGSEFPADYGAMGDVVVPVRDPGVHEDTRQIVLEDLAVTFELVDVVDH